jgi:hypothetical protein
MLGLLGGWCMEERPLDLLEDGAGEERPLVLLEDAAVEEQALDLPGARHKEAGRHCRRRCDQVAICDACATRGRGGTT